MRIALFSDVHGNLPALEAVFESKEFKECKAAYCLGDLVGYYQYPNECVELVRKHKIQSLAGNHDYACVANEPCRDNEVGLKSQRLMQRLVSENTKRFLASLPAKLEIEVAGKRFYLVHGSPANPRGGYVNPDDPVEVPAGFDLLAMGNTHKPFVRREGSAIVVNPGSVGQPRDGMKGACFAVVDTVKWDVIFHRAGYDASELIKKVDGLGLKEAAEALRRLK